MHNQYPIDPENDERQLLYDEAAGLIDQISLQFTETATSFGNENVIILPACTEEEYRQHMPLATVGIRYPKDVTTTPSANTTIEFESRVPGLYDTGQKFVIGIDGDGRRYVDAGAVIDSSKLHEAINNSSLAGEDIESDIQALGDEFVIHDAESNLTLDRADVEQARKLVELLKNALVGGVYPDKPEEVDDREVVGAEARRVKESARRIFRLMKRKG